MLTQAQRYQKIRAEAFALLGGKCVVCGRKDQLELDHIDPSTKTIEMSACLSVPRVVYFNELKKCQILCARCHDKKCIRERGQNDTETKHGTLSTYNHGGPNKKGCRCDLCRMAKRLDARRRRKYAVKKVRRTYVTDTQQEGGV